jgi:hypothetical protein
MIERNAFCDLVSILDICYLLVEHVYNTMDLVLDYTIEGTPRVPSYFQVFQERDGTKLEWHQKCFLSLIYQNCGEVRELSNRMVGNSFCLYQGGQH